ncbi:unnamed protein product [Adineta ricciae]|uniref:Mab-21-like HhH/H2TH-like domain-containing protein n=1 Tax=Adineta ricciae TaxID=249248 RepID=A0A815FKS0_ADIRI|nr:unnamed protein product [Adineta ricciae]
MATITKIGNQFFVSGSTIEGAAYARHFAQQSIQDLDMMLVEGRIISPSCILKLKDAVGFVQVKYDENYIQLSSHTPFSTKSNQNGILCINGLKMKEKYCGTESIYFLPTSTIITTGQTAINSASAEVKFKCNSSSITLDEQFENILNSIRRIKAQEHIECLQSKYILVCNTFLRSLSQFALPLISTIAEAENLNLQTFKDLISLTSPIYNIQMPQVIKVRLNDLLEFYEKYKHLGNESFLKEYIEYGQLCINNEADFVPALQLDFWPDDIQSFLERIHRHRPQLYQLIIDTTSMHLIPKWSEKTAKIDEELEFRYSFSEIERTLAMNRTRVEQILNGVARSIYYKYLKHRSLIPSYLIKTTVLWMCELRNLNDQFTDEDDDRTIALVLAEQWLVYVKEILSNGVCKHYFIDEMNLLGSCSTEALQTAIDILEHGVDLDADEKINIFIEQKNLLNQHRHTMENWFGNMKVKDILDAMNEYKLLKENWLCPSRDFQDNGSAIDCLHVLNLLRTLDGPYQQNWSTFKRLFLDTNETNWLPCLWGEAVDDCSPSDFVDSLVGLGNMLSQIQTAMEKEDFDGTINMAMNQHEFSGVQNILNDLIKPSNMVHNNLMTSWLPMLIETYFNELSTSTLFNARAPFQHRSIIDNHPNGPLSNLLKNLSLPSEWNSSMRQPFLQYGQHVSNNFFDLLNNAPDHDMTINDLIKYYEPPLQTSSQSVTTSSIPKQIISHATNSSSINKEEFTLVIFDPDFDIKTIEEDQYRSINDYVLFYAEKSQLLSSIQSINEEKILIIIFDQIFDRNFLDQLQNLNQVDSISIYSIQGNYDESIKNDYSKLIDIYTDKLLLFEQLRMRIKQLSTLIFGFHNVERICPTFEKFSKDNGIFFWNLLLKDYLMINSSADQSLLVEKCREYYRGNADEMENIELFEKTYRSENAFEWYLKHCFLSKQLNKAFRTADVEQLKLFRFFIDDLCSNIKSTNIVHRTVILSLDQYEMLLKNIGQLMTFSGLLINDTIETETIYSSSKTQVIVKFEVKNMNSIDLNNIFQLNSFEFDDNLQLWIAHLMMIDNGNEIKQQYLSIKQQTMEKMTLPIIMGDLLFTFQNLSKVQKYFENLQNEDDALIYNYYGNINYLKGEYDLALENFQISYELMISDERIKDTAFLLHDIGYVYDMKKDYKEAYDYHMRALEIRQIYSSEDDIQIGISLYNIGRTLVTMNNHDQALIYHQKALNIWEKKLPFNHHLIAQSLHSHGVVYFNKRDYTQASYYYKKALDLYEKITPRDEHGILMIKNILEQIQDLTAQQLITS